MQDASLAKGYVSACLGTAVKAVSGTCQFLGTSASTYIQSPPGFEPLVREVAADIYSKETHSGVQGV